MWFFQIKARENEKSVSAFRSVTKRILVALSRFPSALWFEIVEWFRAFLRVIPGEIGCVLRNRLYGFKSNFGVRVLTHSIVYHPHGLTIGRNSAIMAYCQLNAKGKIDIGTDVLIGPGVMIWSQNHRYMNPTVPIRLQDYDWKRVVIESDVWIGAGAIILPGVHLAQGTVVAAGAIVTKPTQPFSVVAGVPARIVGYRSLENSSMEQDEQNDNGRDNEQT
jgi:maltose O-acetyltransferase